MNRILFGASTGLGSWAMSSNPCCLMIWSRLSAASVATFSLGILVRSSARWIGCDQHDDAPVGLSTVIRSELPQRLKKLDVTSFTEAPKVVGIGQPGTRFSSFAWPGHHSMIRAAMVEQQADEVAK